MHLPARQKASGTARKLREEQIVKLMFPTFNEQARSLPKDALGCTGEAVFSSPVFNGGQLVRRSAWPFVEQEGDITYGSGGDRLKVVWLRTHEFTDGTSAGPVAVYRTSERFAELFALGVHRGQPDKAHLGMARMGSDILVTMEQDGCSNRKEGSACETTLRVLLPRRGVPNELVVVPVERVAYKNDRSKGMLEYRLTSIADFREDSIHLVEQILVKEDKGDTFRKAEHERHFLVDDSGNASASEPSLWDQFFNTEAAPAPKTSPPPPR
jgi:hypothetical protein